LLKEGDKFVAKING